jgi:hypothetical protein
LLQYILRSESTEKIPSNFHCTTGSHKDACQPGFFLANITTTQSEPYACCPGYFCPVMLTCMMPCPYGSYCPRYVKQGTSQVLCLCTGFPYKVLSLSTKPEVPGMSRERPTTDDCLVHSLPHNGNVEIVTFAIPQLAICLT